MCIILYFVLFFTHSCCNSLSYKMNISKTKLQTKMTTNIVYIRSYCLQTRARACFLTVSYSKQEVKVSMIEGLGGQRSQGEIKG